MSRDGTALDGSLLLRAFKDAAEWVLDVAAHTARDFPDEVAAVERVRTFMRARSANRPAQLRFDDLLFAFALLLAAIERDLGPLAQRAASFAHDAKFELRFAA